MRQPLILLLLFLTCSTYAHVDKTYTFQYEKTFISIKTAFYSEEVERVKIIGKLVSKLAAKYNYDDRIVIDLIHNENYKEKNQIFLTYSLPTNKHSEEYGSSYIDSVKHQGNFIFLKENNSIFNIEHTIKLIEFALSNTKYLKNNSSYIEAEPYSCISISEDKIQSIISDEIQEIGGIVMSQKIYKEEAVPPKISYYSKNGEYILFKRETNGDETVIDTLHNVFRIISTSYYCFAFTSWDEFKYYSRTNDFISSKDSYKVNSDETSLTPIKVEELNSETFLIFHSMILWHEPLNVSVFDVNKGIKIKNLLE